MNVLLVGVGMQGKAALHDLYLSPAVERIVVADRELAALQHHARQQGYGAKVRTAFADAESPPSLQKLLAAKPDVVVDLTPSRCSPLLAREALRARVHLVNTVYVLPALKELEGEIAAAGLTFLPEFGMDPGIDLVLLGRAAGLFDRIDAIDSYGAGVPEPGADDNPLRYKVTWTFAGVLRAYMRGGRLIRNGRAVNIKSNEMFNPENIHELKIPGLGTFEAYVNGDSLPYAQMLGIDPEKLQRLGRYSFRWPGHSAFWKKLVDLHLLDDEPLQVDGVAVNKRNFLAAAIEPHIRLGEKERDAAVLRVDITGIREGRKTRATLQVIDRRDLSTGFTAMSRTVGFTASIGAQLIGSGRIGKRGLLSPLRDVPYEIFKAELAKRAIPVSEELQNLEQVVDGR